MRRTALIGTAALVAGGSLASTRGRRVGKFFRTAEQIKTGIP